MTATPTATADTPEPAPAATTAPRSGLGYLPGLDGIRAFALMPVMLFHSGFTWVPGAMFGLSTFFTMSGYLITSLLLEEHKGTGGVALGGFWKRRFRRLLPASLLAMVLAIAFGVFAADATQRAELGGDVAASLGYVANWWFIASGQSYAALFTAPSPLLHIWSLAVEEQFYLVLPLVAFAFLRRRATAVSFTRVLVGFGAVIAVAFAVTFALPFVFDLSDDFFYYSTPTRLPEMLAGVLLAVVMAPGTRRNVLRTRAAAPWATVGGIVSVAIMVWLWANVGLGTYWVYHGGFAAFSLVSIVLILSVHNAHSPVTKLLTIPIMLHIGRISYGIYLFHWPIFLWITPGRTGLEAWPLFGVRMAVTVALAELSFRFIETPIRKTGRLNIAGVWRPLGRWAPVAIAAIVVTGFVVSATAPAPPLDLARSERELSEFTEQVATPPPTAPAVTGADVDAIEATLPVAPPPVRISVFGDSSALTTTFGLGRWATENPTAEFATGATMVGCGIYRTGDKWFSASRIDPLNDWCKDWPNYWAQRARAALPNTALVQAGPWEVLDRRLTPDGPFVGPGDPTWEQATLDDMLAAIDLLNAEGAFVAWATAPPPNANLGRDAVVGPETFFGDLDNIAPERFVEYNRLVNRLPGLRPGRVAVVDLAGWHADQGERDLFLRPDGVHAGDEGTNVVANEFLGPELQRLFNEAWTTGAARRLTAEAIARWAEVPPLQRWQPGEPLRVLVWSDTRAPDVVTAVEDWQARFGPGAGPGGTPVTLDVEVVAPAECGVARTNLVRTGGSTLTVSDECTSRTEIERSLATFRPHLVVLAPGWFEHAEHMPYPVTVMWVTPGMPFADLWLTDEFGGAADTLRASGAMVAVVNLAGPPPGADTSIETTTRTEAINITLRNLAGAPARAGWIRLADVRDGADPATALNDAVAATIAAANPETNP